MRKREHAHRWLHVYLHRFVELLFRFPPLLDRQDQDQGVAGGGDKCGASEGIIGD